MAHGGRTLLSWLGLGAGAMYYLDPDRGKRRRALVRDQALHLRSQLAHGIALAGRDLAHRLSGTGAEWRARLRPEPVSDLVLAERVRAKMGRYVSHPGAIAVTAHDGAITLSGAILDREKAPLIAALQTIPGLKRLDDQLSAYPSARGISSLQGGKPRSGQQPWKDRPLTPGTRLLIGLAGSSLALGGLGRKSLAGSGLGALGLGLLARSLTNLPMNQLLGLAPSGFTVRKSITVNTTVDRVFSFWQDYQNFPAVMGHVREVKDLGQGRSSWTVAGPAGVPIRFEAELTRLIRDEVIAWRSVAGATVEHEGQVSFEALPDGSTRLHVQMSYAPPAGAIGHLVASMFGANPKQEMDEDLNQAKRLIEASVASAS